MLIVSGNNLDLLTLQTEVVAVDLNLKKNCCKRLHFFFFKAYFSGKRHILRNSQFSYFFNLFIRGLRVISLDGQPKHTFSFIHPTSDHFQAHFCLLKHFFRPKLPSSDKTFTDGEIWKIIKRRQDKIITSINNNFQSFAESEENRKVDKTVEGKAKPKKDKRRT